MQIQSCRITAFGRLRDLEFEELDSPVVVVRGPNEAGKSTFFHFLQTMLYGVYPTDETNHPYAPRDSARLEGQLSVKDFDGGIHTVSRRLLSSPRGDLVGPDGSSVDLRNRTLPLVSHISQDVFEAVFALSLYDLTALSDESAWGDIQDRLLGSLSIDYIRPTRSVVADIEEEATSLWRSDRRGKPRSGELRDRLSELRKAAGAAQQRDAELRAISSRLQEREEELKRLKEERISLVAEKRRMERLVPVQDRLRRIERARAEAGDFDELKGLPGNPEERLEELRSQRSAIDRQIEQLEKDRETAAAACDAVPETDAVLLENAAEISSWSKRSSTHRRLCAERSEADRAKSEARGRLRQCAEGVLTDGWVDERAERLAAISISDLRQRIDAFAEATDRLEERRMRDAAHRESLGAPRRDGLGWAAAAVMAVASVASAIAGIGSVASAALVLSAGAALWAYNARRHNAKISAASSVDILEPLQADVAERRRTVASALAGVPLPAGRIESPDPYLANDVQRLQQALKEWEAARDHFIRLGSDIEEEVEALSDFIGRFPHIPVDDEDPELLISRLEKALAEAEERARTAESARTELERIGSRRGALDRQVAELETKIQEVETRIAAIGEGDVAQGLSNFRIRRDAAQRVQSYEEDLRNEVPELERIVKEIKELDAEGAEWRLSDEQLSRLDQHLDDTDERINELTGAVAEDRKDVERLLDELTLDAIESERAQLEEELAELGRRRDRLMMLANAIKMADHRFREEHQPDVLRRAGAYLARITNGRYERLDYEEGTNTMRVFETEYARGYEVGDPLSRGTLDQIYLAVRLAIVDHLDEGHERLPVFLDEVFVNWDAERRERCYEIFQDVSARRQLFVFTCHPWLSDELSDCLAAAVIDLNPKRVMV